MDKNEQIRFVNELMGNLQDEIIEAIQDGKTPESWDGIELRWLIADYAAACVWKGTGNKSRKGKYNNHCLIENRP